MAGNPKPDANTNRILCSTSMDPPPLAPLLLLLLLAVSVDASAAPSPSQAPSPYPASGPAPSQFGRSYGPPSYFLSPPAPARDLFLPPPLPATERRSNLNYGQKMGFAFLGLALVAQVVLGGFLAFERWQLGKLEYYDGGGGVRRGDSDASSLHSS